MAIFKTANGTGKYRDLRSRSDLISYITNPQKAPNHVFYAMVDPSDPVGHMNRIATQFGKTDGVKHATLFFPSFQQRSTHPQLHPALRRTSRCTSARNTRLLPQSMRIKRIYISMLSRTPSAMWTATATTEKSGNTIRR